MKLKKIELDGFGKLVQQVFDFGPGLTLIYGRNEAGKSTLQRSIFAALYGFFDEGTITAGKKVALSSFVPWDLNASFRVKLTFEMDEGAQYRVERTFAPKLETNLYDLKSGKNVNGKFPSASQGRLYFAEKLLGMPREVFENTCLVRQAELAALEKSASSITDALLRLSASTTQESTASQALELLDNSLREQVGTARSRNKPLPEAQRRLEILQRQRAELQSQYQSLSTAMQELAQTEDAFAQLERERDKAAYQHLLAQYLIVKQQVYMIEQSDQEVERRRAEVAKYQHWSSFPGHVQPKVQRLTAQLERAESEFQAAEKAARSSILELPALALQLQNLHKSIKPSPEPFVVPGLEEKPAEIVRVIVGGWLEQKLAVVERDLLEQEQAIQSQGTATKDLLEIGFDGISNYRQQLASLGRDLAQAQRVLMQTQERARESGLPEEEWETSLEKAKAKIGQWQKWSAFPVELRNDLVQLKTRYLQLQHEMTEGRESFLESERKLGDYQRQIGSLELKIQELETGRKISAGDQSRIQGLAFQLDAANQAVEQARERLRNFNETEEQKPFSIHQADQSIQSLEQLGIGGLNTLQQRWLNAKQQLAMAHSRSGQAKMAWEKVGMSPDSFLSLEKTVTEIKEGVRPVPKPRRGCRSLLMKNRVEGEDQTPTEFKIYSDLQPLYTDYVRQQEEITAVEKVLNETETELRLKLGPLAQADIHEAVFTEWIERLQTFQQEKHQREQFQSAKDSLVARLQESENQARDLETRLRGEFERFGITDSSIHAAIAQFTEACEQGSQLSDTETTLNRLQAQVEIARQQVEQFRKLQRMIEQVETAMISILSKAGIESKSETLSEDILGFEQGIQNYGEWSAAQSHYDNLNKQIMDFQAQLSEARATIAEKQAALDQFRKHMADRFAEHLPSDFSDQHFAKLTIELQAYQDAKANLEKAQGQLGKLRLQAQSLQRDLDNWVDRLNAAKQVESQIFQAIQEADIQITELSVEEACKRFESAYEGFIQWQQAQSALKNAEHSQAAVRDSLPDLEAERKRIEGKIANIKKKHPEWKDLTVTGKPEGYEDAYRNLNDKVNKAQEQLTRLQDSVNRGTKNIRQLAELDEEIDLALTEVQRLNNLGQALELAMNELNMATQEFQKMFAPHLERIVESGLTSITDKRYRKVNIDPKSLNVHVLAPEKNALVPTEQLSTGTRDLIYLILRMGIAQLMSNSGEKLPLLLDDPLVEFDHPRQQASLAYLKELSSQNQVLLFTKDPDIVSWLKQDGNHKVSPKLIELQ